MTPPSLFDQTHTHTHIHCSSDRLQSESARLLLITSFSSFSSSDGQSPLTAPVERATHTCTFLLIHIYSHTLPVPVYKIFSQFSRSPNLLPVVDTFTCLRVCVCVLAFLLQLECFFFDDRQLKFSYSTAANTGSNSSPRCLIDFHNVHKVIFEFVFLGIPSFNDFLPSRPFYFLLTHTWHFFRPAARQSQDVCFVKKFSFLSQFEIFTFHHVIINWFDQSIDFRLDRSFFPPFSIFQIFLVSTTCVCPCSLALTWNLSHQLASTFRQCKCDSSLFLSSSFSSITWSFGFQVFLREIKFLFSCVAFSFPCFSDLFALLTGAKRQTGLLNLHPDPICRPGTGRSHVQTEADKSTAYETPCKP